VIVDDDPESELCDHCFGTQRDKRPLEKQSERGG
jgi:hypothetical protein